MLPRLAAYLLCLSIIGGFREFNFFSFSCGFKENNWPNISLPPPVLKNPVPTLKCLPNHSQLFGNNIWKIKKTDFVCRDFDFT